MPKGFDEYRYEIKEVHGQERFAIYGYGTYEETSVLAGQRKRVFIEYCDTEELAQKKTGDLRASLPPFRQGISSGPHESGETLEELSGLPSCPPDWFDPADAGESWDGNY